jgi:hypothetical protein
MTTLSSNEMAHADTIASDFVVAAQRDQIKVALDDYAAKLHESPPDFCVGLATGVAHAIFQTDNPPVMRAAMFMLIDRMLVEATETMRLEAERRAEQDARDATLMADSLGLDHAPNEKEPEA